MKFLLDVCVTSRSLGDFLTGLGHDVLSALVVDPKSSDERLMELALRDDRVLVTEDKDFGELVGNVVITMTRGRMRIRHRT